MQKTIKHVLYIVVALMLLSSVVAVPPATVVSTGDFSLDIECPGTLTVQQDREYQFFVHVYNHSDGYPLTSGISCYLTLYNKSGGQQYEGTDVTSTDFDYEFVVGKGNFSNLGVLPYVIHCNTSDSGGFCKSYLHVTRDGYDTDSTLMLSMAVILSVIIILFFMVGMFLYLKFQESGASGER